MAGCCLSAPCSPPQGLFGPPSDTRLAIFFHRRFAFILQLVLGPLMLSGSAVLNAQETWTVLPTIPTSDDTSTTVQSKAWFHGHTWWAVLPTSTPSNGSWLFRLEANNTWTPVLKVSSMKGKSDTKAIGNLTHVLHRHQQCASRDDRVRPRRFRRIASGPPIRRRCRCSSAKRASLEVDSTGRLWLATDHFNWVYIYYATIPYSIVHRSDHPDRSNRSRRRQPDRGVPEQHDRRLLGQWPPRTVGVQSPRRRNRSERLAGG